MAYNYVPNYNYLNPYFQPPQMQPAPQPQAQQQPQNNSGLVWVQGETGAKSYMVAPNSNVLLMDSENQRFYIKSADSSGMPLPLRIFEYKEISAASPEIEAKTVEYVTREEFEKKLSELTAKPRRKEILDE